MPQTNHGSIEFLKFPDPQHPGDNTHLIKKWLRDSWARKKIATLQNKFTFVTGTLASAVGFSPYASYPTGFNYNNCEIVQVYAYVNGVWRTGYGLYTGSSRLWGGCDSTGIRLYNTDGNLYGLPWKALLMRTDI